MLSREQIVKLLREKVTHPATSRELIRILKVPREEHATFRRLLKALVSTGELIETKGGRVGLPDKMDLVVGRLTLHSAGYGFVVPDKAGGDAPDVYVSAANIKEAMHGDRVLARIERRSSTRMMRPSTRSSLVRRSMRASTRSPCIASLMFAADT